MNSPAKRPLNCHLGGGSTGKSGTESRGLRAMCGTVSVEMAKDTSNLVKLSGICQIFVLKRASEKGNILRNTYP